MSLSIRKAKTDFKAVKLHVIGINYPLSQSKKKKKKSRLSYGNWSLLINNKPDTCA